MSTTKMISTTAPTIIRGLISLHDEPMLESTTSFDSLDSDYISIAYTAPINIAVTPNRGGIQRAHASMLGRGLLLGIVPPEADVDNFQKVRCDSWLSVYPDDLQEFFTSLPVALRTETTRKADHHRSQYTLVGSDFVVNEY